MRLFLCFVLWISLSCKNNPREYAPHINAIIPKPIQCLQASDHHSRIKNLVLDEAIGKKKDYLHTVLSTIPNCTFSTNKNDVNVQTIMMDTLSRESYILEISDESIAIQYADDAGLQYAITTLAQIVTFNGYPLPNLSITDGPKFSYRGLHLDVARHFFPIADVKKFIDFMAYYKYNKFHWHLTDDQGWRMEIKKYPKLQEVAAFRDGTLIGHYSDQPHRFDDKKYGGYYTQEEAKEIVSYAAERNIEVIPEIEMPGHSLAALTAYPELGCTGGPYQVAKLWGVFDDVFCPYEKTFDFLEDVMDEVVEIFPSKYIHIGGDECPKESWKQSAFCQDLILKNHLKDEHSLQSYFITRMEKYINSKGKQIIGWDEILEGGLAPNATVMSWRGMNGGAEAANASHDVIMTPTDYCYFDYYQSESADEPLAIGGYLPLARVYSWNAIPYKLEAEKHKYIIGGQANTWTEYISDFSKIEYMTYVRAIAMSEVLWGTNNDYVDFVDRYKMHNSYWKSHQVNIANHIFELKLSINAGNGQEVSINFNLPKGEKVNVIDSKGAKKEVDGILPYVIQSTGDYQFIASNADQNIKPLDIHFDLHLGTQASITLQNKPASKYSGNGPGSLINGVMGSDQKYGGSEWLGFEGEDCIAILHFQKEQDVKSIDLRFFNSEGQWIYAPKAVKVFASTDGENFTFISETNVKAEETKVVNAHIDLKETKTSYLKIEVENYGLIAAGKQGAGNKAWLFVDEIVIQ